ncbi:Fra a 1-associated protein-like protein [Drosera capensis]
MGWVWRDDADDEKTTHPFHSNPNPNPNLSIDIRHGLDSERGGRCSTRKIVTANCHTEEVEPGKFVRKCQKTEKILRDCVGEPTKVVTSNTEYTEDVVTQESMNGNSIHSFVQSGPFDFPGQRSDMEAIERSLSGGISRFFEAVEEMKNGFFRVFDDDHVFRGSSSSRKREIRFDGGSSELRAIPKFSNLESGHPGVSGLARDV